MVDAESYSSRVLLLHRLVLKIRDIEYTSSRINISVSQSCLTLAGVCRGKHQLVSIIASLEIFQTMPALSLDS